MHPTTPSQIVRLENDQFQVLHDMVCFLRDTGQKPCCDRVLAMMMLVAGMWDCKDAPAETELQRFARISRKVLGLKV
jgi:hypothetical protein